MASCGVDVEETLFIMCPYPTKSYRALPCDGLEVSIKERSSRESRTSGSWAPTQLSMVLPEYLYVSDFRNEISLDRA